MPEMEINIMKVLILQQDNYAITVDIILHTELVKKLKNLGLSVNIAKYLRMQSHQQEHRLHSQL